MRLGVAPDDRTRCPTAAKLDLTSSESSSPTFLLPPEPLESAFGVEKLEGANATRESTTSVKKSDGRRLQRLLAYLINSKEPKPHANRRRLVKKSDGRRLQQCGRKCLVVERCVRVPVLAHNARGQDMVSKLADNRGFRLRRLRALLAWSDGAEWGFEN